jgi:hypothetical protein
MEHVVDETELAVEEEHCVERVSKVALPESFFDRGCGRGAGRPREEEVVTTHSVEGSNLSRRGIRRTQHARNSRQATGSVTGGGERGATRGCRERQQA